jgi:hypothetical protein
MGKKRTIHLTDRRPVDIDLAEWPQVASAYGDDCDLRDPALYQQALDQGQADTWKLVVRQHADGRLLVYGYYTEHILGSDHHDGLDHAGELLETAGSAPADDFELTLAIRRVGATLGVPAQTIADCIADLPPTDLSVPPGIRHVEAWPEEDRHE